MQQYALARWAWFGFAAMCLAAVGALGSSPGSKTCKTIPCTYYNHGQPLSGKCGAVKAKKGESWECIVNAKKKIEQIQSGCS